jgi:hypothetical protein
VQCSAVQCSAVQCSTVQCSAVQCSAVQCSAVQCSAVQCSAVSSAAQCSPPQAADSGQLYSSAMQGLSSYANNIMGHTMGQYAAQSSLLSTQVTTLSQKHTQKKSINMEMLINTWCSDIAGEQQHQQDGSRLPLWRHPAPRSLPWHGPGPRRSAAIQIPFQNSQI